MVEAWYLLIAFGLGWWAHPTFSDVKTIRDGCPVQAGEAVPMPPKLPDTVSTKEVTESRAAHRTALRVCNQRIESLDKSIKDYNANLVTVTK